MNKYKVFSKMWYLAILLVAFMAGCASNGAEVGTGPTGTLASISLTPLLASIPVTGTQQYSVTAIYSDGSSSVVTADPATTWTKSEVPAVVGTVVANVPGSPGSVSGASGFATGTALGTSTITAHYSMNGISKTATATLTVSPKTLQSLLLRPASAAIPVNGTQQFAVVATWSDQTSSDVTTELATTWTKVEVPVVVGNVVATLSAGGPGAGFATGTALGTSTITAHYTINGVTKTAPATLTVNSKTLLSLMLRPALATIAVNGTQQYSAVATWSDQTSSDVTTDLATTWTKVEVPVVVGNVVATLSAGGPGAGLATGKAFGTSTITAHYTINGVTKTAPAILTVSANILLPITPGAFCPAASGATIPTATLSNPTSDNQFVTTSTVGVAGSGKLIIATFSMPMDSTTINSAIPGTLKTFTLKETVTGNNVPGTVLMDNTNMIATYTTSATLTDDMRYTVSITTAAKSATGIAIACPYEWNFKTTIPPQAGIGPVNLGKASTFGIAATAGVVNVGATTVNGDVVLDPDFTCNAVTVGSAGLIGACAGAPPVINGTVVSQLYPDAGVTSGSVIGDLRAAYISLAPANLPGATNIAAGTTLGALAGSALVEGDNLFFPGVYQSGSTILITGDLTLDASGNPDAVFVFQSSGAIGTAATGEFAPHSRILLVNGAKASNVFWWVGSNAATLGTYSEFQGNILSYSSITMETGATSCGRLFAGASTDGAFVFGNNIVSVPGNLNAPASCK